MEAGERTNKDSSESSSISGSRRESFCAGFRSLETRETWNSKEGFVCLELLGKAVPKKKKAHQGDPDGRRKEGNGREEDMDLGLAGRCAHSFFNGPVCVACVSEKSRFSSKIIRNPLKFQTSVDSSGGIERRRGRRHGVCDQNDRTLSNGSEEGMGKHVRAVLSRFQVALRAAVSQRKSVDVSEKVEQYADRGRVCDRR